MKIIGNLISSDEAGEWRANKFLVGVLTDRSGLSCLLLLLPPLLLLLLFLLLLLLLQLLELLHAKILTTANLKQAKSLAKT